MKRLAFILIMGTLFATAALLAASTSQAAQRAEFEYSPFDPDINTEVSFDASESFSNGRFIESYEWDFDGDGLFEVQTEEPQITHLFDQSGDLNVSLRVTDSAGSSETFSDSLFVRSASVMLRREITTPLAPNRVTAGSAFQVKITATFLEDVSAPGIDEELPEGWRVGAGEHGEALFKSSEAQWIWSNTITAG